MSQLVAHGVGFAHGPNVVLDDVSLTVAPGMRIGLVGPNGVGKSTLLRVLAGELVPDQGLVERAPADTVVGHLTQELSVGEEETVADVVRRRTGVAAAQFALDAATAALAEGHPGAADDYDVALHRWLRLGAADLDHRLDAVLDTVGLAGDRAGQRASTLSGGERARVNLASVLLAGFDVLALDEPTNDLDLAGLALLEDFLIASPAAFLLVSHDRTFLGRVVTSVVELDEHDRTATRFEGGWQAYLDEKATTRRLAEQAYGNYTSTRDDLRSRAQRQHEWADQGKSKATKSGETDKFIRHHNVSQSEKLAGKAKATEKAIARLDVVEKPWEGWDLRLEFATTGRSGAEAIRLRNATVDRGAFRLGPIDLDIGYGERLAVTGPNGAGKSTLLGLALGTVSPSGGEAHLGPSVIVGTLDQRRTRFVSDAALIDAFTAELGAYGTTIDRSEARSQLAKLGLGADHIARPTAALSPGERTRAVLAAFALVGVNLLVLDEPTNHLDLPAIEQLEAALANYAGTLVLVTHDRAMLEAVTTTRRIEIDRGQIVGDEAC